MNDAELQEKLGIDDQQLASLVDEGMPHVTGDAGKRSFDPAAVDAWLLEHGYAAVAEPGGQLIARTYAELARALGMKGKDPTRQLQRWAAMEGFPGRPGSPGKGDGHFPVDEIREWLDTLKRAGIDSGDSELTAARKRLALLEVEERERDARKRLGEMIESADVRRFFEQCVVNTKAVLNQIPDEILAGLPAELPESERTRVYNLVSRRLNEAYIEIAQLLEGDTDPTSDDDGEGS